ncbi:hypothetical protein TEQG_02935 [Trichophyton equinum CBS 127.97]|uniref:C6 finger domain transcription factor nscR n=1 Tax=Trichophyton equinum (strain ATCC MYA-4606 / CBS 127.97) TaxID=559882 RepID=F2PPT4_TRIEC|nr:hypothetical protein TEQG_02935 [Trichophyton equinum CBS 127.97]
MTKSDILGSSQVGSSESDQPARASNACESCRRRKKKCDRISPTCSSCRKHLLQCSYPRVSRISQLKVLRERLQVLENAISTKDSGAFTQAQDMEIAAALITASSIQEIELPQIYPVESQWYMPELLRFYSESIALQSQGDGSFTQLDTLQNIWMITALADEYGDS